MSNAGELVDLYLAAWNEPDEDRRREIVARTYTEEATYVDPLMQGAGHSGITAMIGAAQAQFPGLRFRLASEVEAHHDHTRFSWELAPADGAAVARGTDVGQIIGGRFGTVVGFLDQIPTS
ncbi:nuclear transport factor 2 family protein [Deinococcus metallilatus]|uniref:Nuclear transport factor 2 family protein n=1 Tax=Deinococcus metallilatus TaxID=1211322 RepID=A0AAJ5F1E5_9DEIO|nr:nuclear transport factor 2 family protein [Deinococcus metallilatus]MBB5296699.1 hypothetical protein [Deinococcus metallilatus]QBY09220.1 nuclear transport factor 2 family protein [Deinococcus metallilatus]RXJ09738.1 nuclear transport factor 2 family protein [Deinococcus metallilatus]TLK24204.1 nuclear transport factor 2 family protein [Deinococcus metallilatus]GMA13730.1 hypothetical protein GCM10025871_00610 [Deinococcus metallilatus]